MSGYLDKRALRVESSRGEDGSSLSNGVGDGVCRVLRCGTGHESSNGRRKQTAGVYTEIHRWVARVLIVVPKLDYFYFEGKGKRKQL